MGYVDQRRGARGSHTNRKKKIDWRSKNGRPVGFGGRRGGMDRRFARVGHNLSPSLCKFAPLETLKTRASGNSSLWKLAPREKGTLSPLETHTLAYLETRTLAYLEIRTLTPWKTSILPRLETSILPPLETRTLAPLETCASGNLYTRVSVPFLQEWCKSSL